MSDRKFKPVLMIVSFLLSISASTVAQNQPEAFELKFWTVGTGGVDVRFGPDLNQALEREKEAIRQILLAISEKPLAENEMLGKTDLSRARLAEVTSKLEILHVIRKNALNQWATTLPVITDDGMKRIRQILIPMAREVARRIKNDLPGMIKLYEQVKSPTDPPWKDVAHLVIDKFIIDGTFHRAIGQMQRERGTEGLYSSTQQIIPAFFMEQGEHFAAFGTNWYPYMDGDGQREVYVLHGSALKRYNIRMNAYRRDSSMSALLFRISAEGSIECLSASQKDILMGLEWIDGDQLLVPVVQATTIKSLWPTLEEVGTRAARVVSDNHSLFTDAFRNSPYSGFLEAAGDYVQVCYHALFGVVLEQLAEAGVVPEFSDAPPEHFGVYIIMGKLF